MYFNFMTIFNFRCFFFFIVFRSQGGKKHPIYTGGSAPSYPIYQEKPPVYYDPAPPAVRPPVYYYNQYPSAPVVSNPSGHYGAAFYISKVHSKPFPPLPSVNADCYTAGTSSLNPSYNSAAATSSKFDKY